MQAASSKNGISYKTFCQLGGCLNSDLIKIQHQNGADSYTTYHHIGYGQAYWKQDKPKWPTEYDAIIDVNDCPSNIYGMYVIDPIGDVWTSETIATSITYDKKVKKYVAKIDGMFYYFDNYIPQKGLLTVSKPK